MEDDLSSGEEILRRCQDHGKYRDELIERGVRLAVEGGRLVAHIAADLGMHPGALRKEVHQAETDSGKRTDLLSTHEREEIRRLVQGELRVAPRE